MLRLRRALLLRAAAKDINLVSGGSARERRPLLAVRGQPVIGTLCAGFKLNLRDRPARPDLSVARALCTRLRGNSAREVARRVLAA